MNILHLLSQNHLTGAEVYAVTLANQQIAQGHNVYQLSNGFYYPTSAVTVALEVESKSKIRFVKNIFWLRNFIRKENIHIIHTHSRASAKLAYWATIFTRAAQVSTVHGIQHYSFSKRLHNQYGQFIIAICENIKSHLQHDFSYNQRRIKIIPNAVSSADFYFCKKTNSASKNLKVAVIGRTTGPKKNRTEQVLNALRNLNAEVTIIGGRLIDLNIDSELKLKVKEIPELKLNSRIYSQYDLIIGSGRVCIESLLTGVKTLAFGEACYVGLITTNNFSEAMRSNFGDIHPKIRQPKINLAQFISDVQAPFTEQRALSELAQAEFSLDILSQKISRLYESAYFLKNYKSWIPILMYHKIPDSEIQSEHKIYVTKNNFEKHLRFFRNQGFNSLTFSELQKFRTGAKNFSEFPKKPLILTFDDGYTDNLINAAPLLKKYHFKAQLFLLADPQINQNTWDANSREAPHKIISGPDRKKWKDTEFEIGSHGFSHKKISSFDTAEALNELIESKKSLEKEFNVQINVYAFTYGITETNSADLAQKAGYDYAVNTDSGGHLLEEDPYRIFRVNMFPNENRFSLYKKTSQWYRKYYHFKRKK